MKKIILLLMSIISVIYIGRNYKTEENIIPDEAIRFRVVANSNSIYDQNIKIQIRNTIQNEIFKLISSSSTIEETRNILKEHEKELYEITNNKLKELNYDKDFTLKYGLNYFPEKKYKGVTYKDGNYESLVITLGNGNGDNFWCVLFPPLCLIEANDNNTTNTEYKFFVKEIIDKYLKK